MSEATQELLTSRGDTYGTWQDNARIARLLKTVVADNDRGIEHFKREALDMIQHKVARILCGDSNYVDNWDDIAGYAVLVANIIRTGRDRNPAQPANTAGNPEG